MIFFQRLSPAFTDRHNSRVLVFQFVTRVLICSILYSFTNLFISSPSLNSPKSAASRLLLSIHHFTGRLQNPKLWWLWDHYPYFDRGLSFTTFYFFIPCFLSVPFCIYFLLTALFLVAVSIAQSFRLLPSIRHCFQTPNLWLWDYCPYFGRGLSLTTFCLPVGRLLGASLDRLLDTPISVSPPVIFRLRLARCNQTLPQYSQSYPKYRLGIGGELHTLSHTYRPVNLCPRRELAQPTRSHKITKYSLLHYLLITASPRFSPPFPPAQSYFHLIVFITMPFLRTVGKFIPGIPGNFDRDCTRSAIDQIKFLSLLYSGIFQSSYYSTWLAVK